MLADLKKRLFQKPNMKIIEENPIKEQADNQE